MLSERTESQWTQMLRCWVCHRKFEPDEYAAADVDDDMQQVMPEDEENGVWYGLVCVCPACCLLSPAAVDTLLALNEPELVGRLILPRWLS